MKKISLVFHKKEKGKIFKKLTQLGTVEIIESTNYDETTKSNQAKIKNEIAEKINKLEFAFSFLSTLSKDINLENTLAYKKLEKETKGKNKPKKDFEKFNVDLKKINRVYDYEYLESYTDSEYELYAEIADLEDISFDLVDLKNRKGRLESEKLAIKKYSMLDIKFSEIKNTQYTSIIAGLIDTDNIKELNISDNIFIASRAIDKQSLLVAISSNSEIEALNKRLMQLGFQSCPYNDDMLASDKISEIDGEIEKINLKVKNLQQRAIKALDNVPAYKFLYDYYLLEFEKQEAIEDASNTKHVVVLEGWVPSDRVEITQNELLELSSSLVVYIEEPKSGEIVPSYFVNNAVVAPFSKNITSMYGVPHYGEIDPNPFVAFFYIVFFGFMLGDFGYGAVLTLACGLFLLIKKPVKDSGSFIKMFMLCGISCMAWGVVFGSYFGLEEPAMTATSFGRALWSLKKLDALGVGSITIFAVALVMGIIQIAVGFVLNGTQKVKNKQIFDGILNDFSWVVIFLGGGIFALPMIVESLNGVSSIKTAGMVVALIGVVMLLVGGALGKKNVFSMIVGGFNNLYGSVNVISDVLSYSRLFGLSLTTGVIALVFNRIGLIVKDMVGGGVFGFLVAIVIWIVGHAFNFGINILSVYVHNSRLQYVEFFGKFYSGEGHAFSPFGHRTKFTYLEEKLTAPKNVKTKK